jgi:hypothetical protein
VRSLASLDDSLFAAQLADGLYVIFRMKNEPATRTFAPFSIEIRAVSA